MQTSIGQRRLAGNDKGRCNPARHTTFSAVLAESEELLG
ncbi:hypothetical protein P3T43_004022 [Paraburkholderia sp. GAS41]|jgi:hypothetical protein